MSGLLALVVIGLGLLAGCEREDGATGTANAPPATASTPAPTPPEPAAGAEDMNSTTEPVTGDARSAVDAAVRDTSAVTNEAAGQANQAVGDATAAATAKAQALIDQATRYIKENKMDLADKAITQLEGMKPQLPQSFHGKIDRLRSMFNNVRKGRSLTDSLKDSLPR